MIPKDKIDAAKSATLRRESEIFQNQKVEELRKILSEKMIDIMVDGPSAQLEAIALLILKLGESMAFYSGWIALTSSKEDANTFAQECFQRLEARMANVLVNVTTQILSSEEFRNAK